MLPSQSAQRVSEALHTLVPSAKLFLQRPAFKAQSLRKLSEVSDADSAGLLRYHAGIESGFDGFDRIGFQNDRTVRNVICRAPNLASAQRGYDVTEEIVFQTEPNDAGFTERRVNLVRYLCVLRGQLTPVRASIFMVNGVVTVIEDEPIAQISYEIS